MVCAALIATLAWTTPARADTCLGSGSTTKCTLDSQCCSGLVCSKRCQRGCKIGGVFYENGTLNPANDCQSCQALVNRFGWTNLAANTTCGGAPVGVCDAQNTCTGGGVCTENYKPSSTVCRSSAGVCDVQENCTGSSKTCPTDVFQPATTVCRSSAGVCDTAESCTGSAAACPADAFLPSSTVCRSSGGVCDVAESCTGSAAACPTDAVEPSSIVCRSSGGVCDVAEHCDGSAKTCPLDVFQSSATVCRSSAGVCDVAENCTGSSAGCPPDGFQSSATVCRSAAGVCDVAESCTGSGAACPTDGVAPSTTVCRSADGSCDVAESCDGVGHACPADAFAPSTQLAFPTRGVCDQPDYCSGTSKLIPLDVTNAGSVCRPSAGVCDPTAEICQLGSDDCPADVKTPAGTDCGGLVNAGACELFTCKGDGTCTLDGSRAPSASCRAPADAGCDERDRCGVVAYVCSGDLVTPCTTAAAPDDGKCQVNGVDNGRCVVDPDDPRNRTDFTSAWSQIKIPGLTLFVPPANGGHLTEFTNYPDCGPDTKKPEGTSCTYTPLGSDGAGKCLDGVCNPLFCKNTIDCPDGSVCGCPSGETCSKDYCIPAPAAHGYGDACTGVAGQDSGDCTGYLCCAGMAGDGNGAVAGAGVKGRCAECCSGFTDDCGGGASCCDGECTDVTSDPHNCTGCNYDGGIDCETLINACNPSVVKCDAINIGSGCVMGEYCETQAQANGWEGWQCDVPQERVPNPACDYCVFPTATPGKPCLTDAECGGFPGSCFRDPSLFCFAMGVPYVTTEECRQPPFDGCTPTCTELSTPANVGHECESDSECFGGTTCKTTCDLSYIWLTAFCFSSPTCQW